MWTGHEVLVALPQCCMPAAKRYYVFVINGADLFMSRSFMSSPVLWVINNALKWNIPWKSWTSCLHTYTLPTARIYALLAAQLLGIYCCCYYYYNALYWKLLRRHACMGSSFHSPADEESGLKAKGDHSKLVNVGVMTAETWRWDEVDMGRLEKYTHHPAPAAEYVPVNSVLLLTNRLF